MIAVLLVVSLVLGVALVALGVVHLSYRSRRPRQLTTIGASRILFPFVANALSLRALDAALRLARAEDAMLVPVFLARVSLHLPLDTPLPRQSNIAIPLQDAIERRATAFGIAVDARIERGRTYRHALRLTIEHERFDRIVIAAAARNSPGFGPDDVAWLLENAPGEIVVLRPGAADQLMPIAVRSRRTVNGRHASTRVEAARASGPVIVPLNGSGAASAGINYS